jgi:mRNA-degrading endonuclease RelE of RelBE toxin-antitoxin system
LPVSPLGRHDYEIIWKAEASRDMDRLLRAIAAAVVESNYGPLAQNPNRVGKPLRFELAGKRSARRGNYRVIYERSSRRLFKVEVIAVQHRADAWRREGVLDPVRGQSLSSGHQTPPAARTSSTRGA